LLDDRSSGGESSESLASNIPDISIPDEQHLRRILLTNIPGAGAWGEEPEERIRSALSRLGEVSDVWVFDEEELERVELVTFVAPGTQRTKKEKIQDRLEKERREHARIEKDILDSELLTVSFGYYVCVYGVCLCFECSLSFLVMCVLNRRSDPRRLPNPPRGRRNVVRSLSLGAARLVVAS
jgi:hypothetical protein